MARPPATLRVGRYLLALLALLAVLYSIVFFTGNRKTPKLGIDLVGGVRVIFTAVGNTTTTQMEQARQIMEDRVNSTGVTGATVQVQNNDQILILIPNGTGKDVANIGAAAKLNFRGVVAPAIPVTCGKYAPAATPTKSTSATPSSSKGATAKATSSTSVTSSPASSAGHSGNDASSRPLAAAPSSTTAKASATATAKASTSATAKASGSASGTAGATASSAATSSPAASSTPSAATNATKCQSDPLGALAKKGVQIPLTDTQYNALGAAKQQQIQQALNSFDCAHAQYAPDLNSSYYVVCGQPFAPSSKQQYAYLLGKVIVPGTQIDNVAAEAPNGSTTQVWTVNLSLKSSGSDAWAKYTSSHNISALGQQNADVTSCSATTVPCADFVAFTLNGAVISSPVNESAINGGTTQITGNFTETSANALADQLKYGSLPLTFRLEANQDVSATLGTTQLHAALLAGGIGLILVVIYSLIYYRALGLVTIASLIVSAGLIYSLLVILGIQLGFTLDLAGITGFIVALGITADSFVVFFERIKDEVHEGRSVRVAVPRAWVRARRTILSADTVSFLAAAILYFFASADVQGFAFTLGMSTILDLVVVFLFTHPLVSLLSRSRAFGSARFTGLNAVRVGGIAVDEPAAVPRGEPRRRRAPSGAAEPDSRAGTVTLTAEPDDEPAHDATPPRRTTAPRGTSETPGTPVTPAQGGTAAERAAARRARMRQRSDQDGDER